MSNNKGLSLAGITMSNFTDFTFLTVKAEQQLKNNRSVKNIEWSKKHTML